MHKEWSTPVAAGYALIGGGVALAAAAAASYSEPPGAVLLALAALLLICAGSVALLRRPRLTLTDGPALEVRTLRGSHHLTRDDLTSVELLSTRHIAARTVQLVVETTDGRLMVFGRWDLGESPQSVAAALESAGFTINDRTPAK
ncbi:MAG: PH domain-containing protein [Gordonia sp. (in: high G+C Gram-positive bacteria)]